MLRLMLRIGVEDLSGRIFIGTSINGEDEQAEVTLAYSLRKHSSEPLEITFMRNNTDPNNPFANFNSKSWATPFSGLRWAIPEVCNFKGRAVYMDVDQLNLKDIMELHNIELNGKAIGCIQGRTCVMVIDCEKFKDIAVPIEKMKLEARYHAKLYAIVRNPKICEIIDTRWNILDGNGNVPISSIWHLHFTSMPTQPWKPAWYKGQHTPHSRKDLVELWEKYRDEAFAELENGI